jgi:S1-C subfamily serine protease
MSERDLGNPVGREKGEEGEGEPGNWEGSRGPVWPSASQPHPAQAAGWHQAQGPGPQPLGPPYGPYGQAYNLPTPRGPHPYGPSDEGRGAYGGGYGGGPGGRDGPYGPSDSPYGPSYGTYPGLPGGHGPARGPIGQGRRPARGLRSAAAALVLAAAAVAGAGLSRVVWPSPAPSSSASGPGSSGSSPSGGAGSGGSASPFGGSGGTTPSGEGAGGPSDVSTIASKVDPAVVDINVIFNYGEAEGAGTGIVLSPNGLVLTNNHVIDEAVKLTVTDVGNGKTYSASVLGYDNTHDVALLKLNGASGLATAKVATSSPRVGEAVVAIGNAGGAGGTPTSAGGSVIALDQSITASDQLTGSSEQLSGLIEVNANVESGDSGGPLADTSGEVIGMDTAASQDFAFSAQGNQGFAIPIAEALRIAGDVESGKGTSTVHVGPTAFLGVELATSGAGSGPQFPPGFGFGGTTTPERDVTGLLVDSAIAGTPAQKVGISQGDVITTFDGERVTTDAQLTHLLVPYHPGQKATIGWVTPTGEARTATLTLASGPPS